MTEKAILEKDRIEAKKSHASWVKAGRPKKFTYDHEKGKRVMKPEDLRTELKEKAKDPEVKKLKKRYDQLKRK